MIRKILVSTAIAAAAVVGFAGVAGATNVNVDVTSACRDSHWWVTAHAKNTHNGPLTVSMANNVEVIGWNLAPAGQPGSEASGTIMVPDNRDSFSYQWIPAGGAIIVGTVKDTLHRPEGCQPLVTTTTTAAVPTTTTIPPETAPPTTVAPPATTVPGGSDVTLPGPPAVEAAPPVVNTPPEGPVQVRTPLPATCLLQANCRPDHDDGISVGLTVMLIALGSAVGCGIVSLGMFFQRRRAGD